MDIFLFGYSHEKSVIIKVCGNFKKRGGILNSFWGRKIIEFIICTILYSICYYILPSESYYRRSFKVSDY
ncbi:hypothetical protein COD94_20685 [Bacillus cereus]|nr:hypothetical protein COD94_20685 [Bacillus cereus]